MTDTEQAFEKTSRSWSLSPSLEASDKQLLTTCSLAYPSFRMKSQMPLNSHLHMTGSNTLRYTVSHLHKLDMSTAG